MSELKLFKPFAWITVLIIGLLTLIINAYIFTKEYKKRKSGIAIFTTKYLKWSSFISLFCGPMVGFFQIIYYFPGFGYICWQLYVSTCYTQLIFMGFYQISRLYYCFAKSQVYSNKGYSKYVFITMTSFGIILLMNAWLLPWFRVLILINGINGEYKYYEKESGIISLQIWEYWFVAFTVIGWFWDIATLLLYLYKIKLFSRYRTENITIYSRILVIMYRIFIMSIFYEITALFTFFILASCYQYTNHNINHIVSSFQPAILSIAYSYSVFLMLQHNGSEYKKFLKCLQKICRCMVCKNIIMDQLNALDTLDSDDPKSPKGTYTVCETRGISVDDMKIETNGNELSMATKTIENEPSYHNVTTI